MYEYCTFVRLCFVLSCQGFCGKSQCKVFKQRWINRFLTFFLGNITKITVDECLISLERETKKISLIVPRTNRYTIHMRYKRDTQSAKNPLTLIMCLIIHFFLRIFCAVVCCLKKIQVRHK